MKNIYLLAVTFTSIFIFYSCNDSSKVEDNKSFEESSNSESDNKIVEVYSGQKIICENCGKIIKENIDTLNVKKNEAINYKITEIVKICKECGEQIPTKKEIGIYNDFNREDIKRIKSVSPEKFTYEYDERTAALVDKKIMNRWKISKREFTTIILKVSRWATENHYLSESMVIEEGLQKAIIQREKIIDL